MTPNENRINTGLEPESPLKTSAVKAMRVSVAPMMDKSET